MSEERRPWFRIYRVDSPRRHEECESESDSHYRAFWKIEDTTYRVHVWSHAEWERRPPEAPSSAARSLNGEGWMVLQPINRR